MLRFSLVITLLYTHSLTALSLKDKLAGGRCGDYIIAEQNQLSTLIAIHEKTEKTITLEEISFPSKLSIKDLQLWINEGAKGHTSWTLLEIDVATKSFERCFSFTKESFLLPNKDDSFFLKILDLPLSPIPDEARRKIGPMPHEGPDTRKVWTPSLVFQGVKASSPEFLAYTCTYPKDGSPLSGKRIELFFNKTHETFPFPYWGQVTDDSGAGLKFRIIDSGQNLSSPKKYPL